MEHHHTYDAGCEHHEELCQRLEMMRGELAYMMEILHTDMHRLGSHVEEIEEHTSGTEEEESSEEEESEHESPEEEEQEEQEAETSAEGEEVVVTDDTGLPEIPTEENLHDSHDLPMMG